MEFPSILLDKCNNCFVLPQITSIGNVTGMSIQRGDCGAMEDSIHRPKSFKSSIVDRNPSEFFSVIDANQTSLVTPSLGYIFTAVCRKFNYDKTSSGENKVFTDLVYGTNPYIQPSLRVEENKQEIETFPVRVNGMRSHEANSGKTKMKHSFTSVLPSTHYTSVFHTKLFKEEDYEAMSKCVPGFCINGGRCVEEAYQPR